ncbi:hypothetical protein [Pectinatus sottacetonis]|uniref:hypothetical protein n=1 Tax=Pectinatus sottacetonis TaxID=1002795 RepID=UPI001E34C968|nr:hypothetical protein [Pectinatus sottacetonis]
MPIRSAYAVVTDKSKEAAMEYNIIQENAVNDKMHKKKINFMKRNILIDIITSPIL